VIPDTCYEAVTLLTGSQSWPHGPQKSPHSGPFWNSPWTGYERIQGALSNLGHAIGRTTIADILHRHGIEPAPERNRKTTWKEFLSRHWELIVAANFFTVEVWTRRGLQRFLVLFFMELSTRKVEIAGIASAASACG